MTAVLDDLGLTGLVTTIAGLTAVGAAAILAETGDPGPVRHPKIAGQARWPVPARQCFRRLPGQDLDLRRATPDPNTSNPVRIGMQRSGPGGSGE
jgi:hypothetical protein